MLKKVVFGYKEVVDMTGETVSSESLASAIYEEGKYVGVPVIACIEGDGSYYAIESVGLETMEPFKGKAFILRLRRIRGRG